MCDMNFKILHQVVVMRKSESTESEIFSFKMQKKVKTLKTRCDWFFLNGTIGCVSSREKTAKDMGIFKKDIFSNISKTVEGKSIVLF